MGRKVQGARLRAKQRANEIASELISSKAHEVETGRIISKPDKALFVIDTTAEPVPFISHSAQRGEKQRQKKRKGLSEMDQQKVQSILEKHSPEQVQVLAKAGRERTRLAKRSKRVAGNAKADFDLWDDDDDEQPDKKKLAKNRSVVGSSNSSMALLAGTGLAVMTTAKPKPARPSSNTVSVQVAHAGQSYHPDPQQHQDVIGEALSLELRRKEAQEYKDAPISTGLSEETKAILVHENDTDSSSSDEDDKDMAVVPLVKKKEKMTRAQRNRQKRIRTEQAAMKERKRAKKLLHSLHELKKYTKELEREKQSKAERREWIKQCKKDSVRALGTNIHQERSKQDPIRAPALPVALTSELRDTGGSVRTIKPKGSLVTDRIDSMVDRKLANRKYVGDKKKVVQGKKRKVVGGKDAAFLLE